VFLPVFVVAAVAFFITRSSGWTIGGPRPHSVSDAEIRTGAALVGALSGLISLATGLLLVISKFAEISQRRRSRRASRRNAATHPQAPKATGRSADSRCPTCHGTGTVAGPDLGPYRQRVACVACLGTGWLHVTAANVEEVTTRIQVDEVTTAIRADVDEVTTRIAVNAEEVTKAIKIPRQSADEDARRLTGNSSEE
jgi:hypothetical protein